MFRSCLDHVRHNLRETCASFVLQPAVSDHYAVACIFNACHNNDRIQIVFRDFSERNTKKFESNVTNFFDNCVLPQQNASECARYLDKFLRASFNSYFPLRTKMLTSKRYFTIIVIIIIDYFVSDPKNMHNSIPPAQLDYSNIVPYYESRFILYQSTPAEVYSAVCKLNKEGPKSDISVKFLKMCCINLATVLCKFFNICFNEAVYPDDFKCSKISPIFKKGSRTHIETHRPISVLPNISKVFDSIINGSLTSYFMSNGLLSASQFGFRENKNT